MIKNVDKKAVYAFCRIIFQLNVEETTLLVEFKCTLIHPSLVMQLWRANVPSQDIFWIHVILNCTQPRMAEDGFFYLRLKN